MLLLNGTTTDSPYYRGVLIMRCPYYRGVLIIEVSLL